MARSYKKNESKKRPDKRDPSPKGYKARRKGSGKSFLDDVRADSQAKAGMRFGKSKWSKATSDMDKEASAILRKSKRKAGKNTDITPFLKISKDMLNRIKHVVAEYHAASRFLGQMEDDDDELDLGEMEEIQGDDESDQSSDSSADEEFDINLGDDELIAAYDAFVISDREDNGPRISASGSDPLQSELSSTQPESTQAGTVDMESLEWLKSIGVSTAISTDALIKHSNSRFDALAEIFQHALKLDETVIKVPDEVDVEAIREEEAMVLDSVYGGKFKRSWDVWEVETTFKIPVPNKKDVCRSFKLGNCRFGVSCKKLHISSGSTTLRLQFQLGSSYPFKAPLIIIQETGAPKIPVSSRIALNLKLCELANTEWLNSPMVSNAVEWLASSNVLEVFAKAPGDEKVAAVLNYCPVAVDSLGAKPAKDTKKGPRSNDKSARAQSSKALVERNNKADSRPSMQSKDTADTKSPASFTFIHNKLSSEALPSSSHSQNASPNVADQKRFITNSFNNEDLKWLNDIGFSFEACKHALEAASQDKLEALLWLFNTVLNQKHLSTLHQADNDFATMQEDEAIILESLFEANFTRIGDIWKIRLETFVTFDLELFLSERYPLDRVLVVLREPSSKLKSDARLALNLRLQELANSWIGQPCIHKIGEFLLTDEARLLVHDVPSRYKIKEKDISNNLAELEAASISACRQTEVKGKSPVVVESSEEMDDDDEHSYPDEEDDYEDIYDAFEDDFVIDNKPGKNKNPRDRKKATNSNVAQVTNDSASDTMSKATDNNLPSHGGTGERTSENTTKPSLHHGDWQNSFVFKPQPSRQQKAPLSEAAIKQVSVRLLNRYKSIIKSAKYERMQLQREQLPAFALQSEIISTIEKNRITVLSGETGCGKTTQPRRISAIGVAERVATERASKLGDTVGYQIRQECRKSAETRILYCTVGILLRRLECGAANDEDGIDDVSHIFVDEVHERSIDSDFLIMVLKELLKIRKDVKLILMSATLNAELFRTYFGGPDAVPLFHIPGRTFPVETLYLEDALALTHYIPNAEFTRKPVVLPVAGSASGPLSRNKKQGAQMVVPVEERPDEDLSAEALHKRYPKLDKRGVNALMLMNTEKIQYPLIEALIEWMVHQLIGGNINHVPGAGRGGGGTNKRLGRGGGRKSHETDRYHDDSKGTNATPPVDATTIKQNRGILVFLPGYDEISVLSEVLIANPFIRTSTANGKYVLPVHGLLSSEQQGRAFARPPENEPIVKIIIATNVAETSITIDDIVYVIDSGKMKETRWDPNKGMASLEECWVSKANASQRCGRAGRVTSGTCFHLFTSHRFNHQFASQQEPEIKRTPLEQLCLRVKVLPFLEGRIDSIIAKVIEAPSPDAVSAAITTLRTIRALNKDETLTPLGFHLAKLPVDVRIGKLILFGSIFGCLDKILTIAAIMSHQSPFVAPFEKRKLAGERKREFALGSSDHLTMLVAYEEWQRLKKAGKYANEKDFLFYYFLSGKTLSMIAGIKRQLVELLSEIGFAPPNLYSRDMERRGGRFGDGVAEVLRDTEYVKRSDSTELVKAVLVAGLYPNVAKIGKNSGTVTVRGNEEAHLHPSSVNWREPLRTSFLIFLEKVRTSQVFIRDSTCVSPYALAFFGGKLTLGKAHQLNMDDGWIRFLAIKKVSATLEAARSALDELLARKIEMPRLEITSIKLIDVIVQLVTTNA
ncbi:hypothetical protein SeMB42_g01483 [Synchytrium endobioticum]|uniref:RNA helicase n=1 Tax=Synchytrium endobioticum TaxID=286115 RepID=A0A507DLQ4_9FUNG|nr:hypothetical protein SeMB42_g01483 [Synchytrium endobioticum]